MPLRGRNRHVEQALSILDFIDDSLKRQQQALRYGLSLVNTSETNGQGIDLTTESIKRTVDEALLSINGIYVIEETPHHTIGTQLTQWIGPDNSIPADKHAWISSFATGRSGWIELVHSGLRGDLEAELCDLQTNQLVQLVQSEQPLNTGFYL